MQNTLTHEGKQVMDHLAIAIGNDMEIEGIHREIEAAELNRLRITHGLIHLPDGTVDVSEEMDLLHLMDHMGKTAERIVSTDGPIIRQVKASFSRGRFGHVLTPLGKAIWTMCRTTVPLIELLFPDCRRPAQLMFEQGVREGRRPEFNPLITVALHACQIAMPILRWCCGMLPDLGQKAVRRALNHLLRTVRRVGRSLRFKYLENNYLRNAKKCLQSCCQYVATAFAKNAKLLIMRVDLYLPPDDKARAGSTVAGRSVSRFVRALREGRIVPDRKAWVVCRENGLRRGIHLHVFVAMDGHKHREAATWSRTIGEAWVNKYSQGRGTYFNCYVRKDWYKLNGLGLVHISDRAKLMGIREALRYMTKADFQVATGYKRNLWRGILRQSWKATKRGAPRKAGNDMALVDEILG